MSSSLSLSSVINFHGALGRSESNQHNRLYWDGGPKAIERYLKHHLNTCEDNKICNALSLQTVVFDDDELGDNLKPGPSTLHKKASPKKSSRRSRSRTVEQPLRIGAYSVCVICSHHIAQ